MDTKELILYLARILQDPIPQYVTGSLPAVAIIGAAPMEEFRSKVAWVLRCLGCPFVGLLYVVNVKNKDVDLFTYWLSSDKFTLNTLNGIPLKKRPIGVHAMELMHPLTDDVRVKECIGKASVLERLSALVSMYYIAVGIFSGIIRVSGPPICEDWATIPLLLSWTFPAVYRRLFGGKIVIKDPNERLEDITIQVKELGTNRSNSGLAFACHLKGEREVIGRRYHGFIHVWFTICGAIVALLLLFLGVLSNQHSLWVTLFGRSCACGIE